MTCIGGEVAHVDLSGGHLDAVDSSQVCAERERDQMGVDLGPRFYKRAMDRHANNTMLLQD